MKDDIPRRFELNLGRAKSLIDAYNAVLPGVGGRPSVATTDILRGSVVFLHASLEDVLRSVLAWKLPSAKPEHLEEVPLVGETIAVSATPACPARLPRSPVGGMLVQDSR